MNKHKIKLKNYKKKNYWQYYINHQMVEIFTKKPYLKPYFHYRFWNGFYIYPKSNWCFMHYLYHRHSETIVKLQNNTRILND